VSGVKFKGRKVAAQTRPEPAAVAVREWSPEELAQRAAQKDAAGLMCFGELVTRFEGRLYNFLLRKTGRAVDAEDLTQEAFVRAWEKIDSYDQRWRFSTWLFTIAARMAVSHHRKARPFLIAEIDGGASEVDDHAGPDVQSAGSSLWRLAEEKLTEDQHTALWLRYAEDMAIPEIAAVMRKSQVGVRVCLFRARQALVEELDGLAAADLQAAPEVVVKIGPGTQEKPRLKLAGGAR
jgi:RNA polymerase sigma-70 factor (ECF subfamily)